MTFTADHSSSTMNNTISEFVHIKLMEGISAQQAGRLLDAQIAYRAVLSIEAEHFDALHMLGVISAQVGDFQEASRFLKSAVESNQENGDAYYNYGCVLQALREHEAAIVYFDAAIKLNPKHFLAFNNRGISLRAKNKHEAAVDSFKTAAAIKIDFAESHNNLGNTYWALNQFQAALASYQEAIRIQPDYADAHYNRGVTLHAMKDYDAALRSYRNAIRSNPRHADAYYSCGLILFELKQLGAAVIEFDQIILIKPDCAGAYNLRGLSLAALRQHESALASYDQAIILKPDFAEAFNNRGIALYELSRLEDALTSYNQAISFNADYAEAYYNRGILLNDTKQYVAAIESFDRALAISPSCAIIYGARLHTKMRICDWQEYNQQVAKVLEYAERGQKVMAPFPFLTITHAPRLHKKLTEVWTAEEYPRNNALGPIQKRGHGKRIRVGYFSMDFRNHPVALLIAGVIEAHDREDFEIYAFSFSQNVEDSMRKRLERAFDVFIDGHDKSDAEVARLARQLEVDIAVDLMGYTAGARTGIFAMQIAPIQVNYLGFAGTMAANYYDYLIADKIVLSKSSRQYYDEKVVYLPNSYQPNDSARVHAPKNVSREDFGLPPTGFVFCCFNNNFKITPSTFEIWLRILTRVEGSVLWLFEDSFAAVTNLRREAAQSGVNADRLFFAARAPYGEHLARHRVADLFLDTFPYNAHTTASDALWAGLPVLTLMGESFASRVAASLLRALDLPELITVTARDYEALAVILASNPARLNSIKRKLSYHRRTTPLFDTGPYTRDLEHAYRKMQAQHNAGLPPCDIFVPHSAEF